VSELLTNLACDTYVYREQLTIESAIDHARSLAHKRVTVLLRRQLCQLRHVKSVAAAVQRALTMETMRRCLLLWAQRVVAQRELRCMKRKFVAWQSYWRKVRHVVGADAHKGDRGLGHLTLGWRSSQWSSDAVSSRFGLASRVYLYADIMQPSFHTVLCALACSNCHRMPSTLPSLRLLLSVLIQLSVVHERFRTCFWPLRTWRKYAIDRKNHREKSRALVTLWETLVSVRP
jgi:hypothetical protein